MLSTQFDIFGKLSLNGRRPEKALCFKGFFTLYLKVTRDLSITDTSTVFQSIPPSKDVWPSFNTEQITWHCKPSVSTQQCDLYTVRLKQPVRSCQKDCCPESMQGRGSGRQQTSPTQTGFHHLLITHCQTLQTHWHTHARVKQWTPEAGLLCKIHFSSHAQRQEHTHPLTDARWKKKKKAIITNDQLECMSRHTWTHICEERCENTKAIICYTSWRQMFVEQSPQTPQSQRAFSWEDKRDATTFYENSDSFPTLVVPHAHVNISKVVKLQASLQSPTIQASRLIPKLHPTIIYFQAAASSISALSESNQSNSKLYPKKWAFGIDSKGQR